MGLFFSDKLHDEFGTWPLAYIRAGGVEIGEIIAVAAAVGDGDDGAFFDAWAGLGDRLAAAADAALAAGHRDSARALLLKACCAYGTAYHPLYGEPVDPRLLSGFRRQMASFRRAMELSPGAPQELRIPFEGGTMPGWLIPAEGAAAERRPLLILTNGYDATLTDMYFATAVAASRRGYHCLVFDGPGQGEMLYEHGIRLRPDWEMVVGAVVDLACTLPQVDAGRIALSGWSLGGYLAPRAASGEARIAACIADPGQWSILGAFRGAALHLGVPPEQAGRLDEVAPELLTKLEAMVMGDRRLRWSLVQRGFWVHGTPDLRGYLRAAGAFTMDGRVKRIRCPTLMTAAENDPLATGTQAFFDALTCPKTLLRFTAAEGAGAHCEMLNRSLLNDRVLDWLDEVFAR